MVDLARRLLLGLIDLAALLWWGRRTSAASRGAGHVGPSVASPSEMSSLPSVAPVGRRSLRVSTEGVPLVVAASINSPRLSDAKPRRSLIVRENSPTHPDDVDELAAAYNAINTHLLKGRAEYADA